MSHPLPLFTRFFPWCILPIWAFFAACGAPTTENNAPEIPADTAAPPVEKYTLAALEQLDSTSTSEQPGQQVRQDLNYDGFADYVLYGQESSSTGLPYWAKIFVYQPATNDFIQDTVIGFLPNPGFSLAQKRITSFHIGLGAGEGSEYRWLNDHWTETLHFNVVASREIYANWRVRDVRKGTTRTLRLPYQMKPPKQVLVTSK
jgi:hypothetical protein